MWFSKIKMKQNKKNKQTACPTTDNSESHVQIYSWNLPISLSPSCPSLQAEVHSGVWAQHQKVVMCAWFHYLFFKEWECNVGFGCLLHFYCRTQDTLFSQVPPRGASLFLAQCILAYQGFIRVPGWYLWFFLGISSSSLILPLHPHFLKCETTNSLWFMIIF